MTDVLILHDLDHCPNPSCHRPHNFFTRDVARQRGVPQLCWSCQRDENQQVAGPMIQRIYAKPPTVVRGFQPDPQGPRAA